MAEPTTSASSALTETSTEGPRDEAAANPAQFSRSLRNVLWLSSGSVLSRVFNVARGVILARLLTPFDFGVYGLGASFVGIKERFTDIGAGTFLVYRPLQVEEHTETAFWANWGLSTLLLAALAAVAPLLGRLYREPLLTPVLVVLALGIWARTNSSIHQNLLRTQSRFRALAIIDYCSSAVWLAVAVLLAWKGFGVWALVVSASAANALTAALLVATQGWRPRFRFSWPSLRLLGGFSFWYLGQGLAWYLASNADRLIIGRYSGMILLGIYTLAYNYATLPVTLIGNAMGSVAFAELPKLYGRPDQLWSRYCEFSRVQAFAACLIAFAGAAAAPELFPLVFGAKWSAAIVPFQILSVSGALRCLWLDPFLAWGNFRLSFFAGLVGAPATALAILFGLRYGLAGACWAVVGLQAAYIVGALLLATQSWPKLVEVSRVTLPYLVVGILTALVAFEASRVIPAQTSGKKIAAAALTLAVFIAVYMLVFEKTTRQVVRETLNRHVPQG